MTDLRDEPLSSSPSTAMPGDGQQQGRIVQVFQSPTAVVSYRAAVGVMVTIILGLTAFLGSQIMAGQDRMAKDQNKMLVAITSLADQVAVTKTQSDRNTAELGDHEHRITVLEVLSEGQRESR